MMNLFAKVLTKAGCYQKRRYFLSCTDPAHLHLVRMLLEYHGCSSFYQFLAAARAALKKAPKPDAPWAIHIYGGSTRGVKLSREEAMDWLVGLCVAMGIRHAILVGHFGEDGRFDFHIMATTVDSVGRSWLRRGFNLRAFAMQHARELTTQLNLKRLASGNPMTLGNLDASWNTYFLEAPMPAHPEVLKAMPETVQPAIVSEAKIEDPSIFVVEPVKAEPVRPLPLQKEPPMAGESAAEKGTVETVRASPEVSFALSVPLVDDGGAAKRKKEEEEKQAAEKQRLLQDACNRAESREMEWLMLYMLQQAEDTAALGMDRSRGPREFDVPREIMQSFRAEAAPVPALAVDEKPVTPVPALAVTVISVGPLVGDEADKEMGGHRHLKRQKDETPSSFDLFEDEDEEEERKPLEELAEESLAAQLGKLAGQGNLPLTDPSEEQSDEETGDERLIRAAKEKAALKAMLPNQLEQLTALLYQLKNDPESESIMEAVTTFCRKLLQQHRGSLPPTLEGNYLERDYLGLLPVVMQLAAGCSLGAAAEFMAVAEAVLPGEGPEPAPGLNQAVSRPGFAPEQ